MNPPQNNARHSSSFRDPSGFLFWHEGLLYRQINQCYRTHYDHVMQSGLYAALVKEQLLIPHSEIENLPLQNGDGYKIIQPTQLAFISYPYEWSFSQLQDAALLTLTVQKKALEYGMSLKDCSAYNIQFWQGRPIFVDTLSFEMYQEGHPWVAYRQFCQHFLAPLALMSYTDIRLHQLFRIYIDGIPLDLASKLLPLRTWLRFSLLAHLHLHAKSQHHFAEKTITLPQKKISRHAFLGLIDNLETGIRRLKWKPFGTEWAEYYDDTNYSASAFEHKHRLVAEFLSQLQPQMVWDLGANVGRFSRIASEQHIPTIAFDIDPAAVEQLYLHCRKKSDALLLPLLLDLTNPSPGLGWSHHERLSLLERGPSDAVLALALIHHLAIGNNVPFKELAEFFSKICRALIIEFVPKQDSQVQRLLVTREDIFSAYTQQTFEHEFSNYFTIHAAKPVQDSERILYVMKAKTPQ